MTMVYGKDLRVLCPLINNECVYSPLNSPISGTTAFQECAFGESEERQHGVEIGCHVKEFIVNMTVWSEDK